MTTDDTKAETSGIHRIDKRHPNDCACGACRAYTNAPYVDLTLRVLCGKCNKFTHLTDRLYASVGMQWSPSIICGHCKEFIEIIEVIIGNIGVRSASPAGEAGTVASEADVDEAIGKLKSTTMSLDVAMVVRRLAHISRDNFATIRSAQAEIRKLRAVVEKQRDGLIKVIGHTGHNPLPPNELLIGLLANIKRIAAAALAAVPGEEVKREG